MSDERNIGDQILTAVDDILASGSFDKLNSVVSDTVYKALDEAQKQLAKVTAEDVKSAGKDVKSAAKDVEKEIRKVAKTVAVSKNAGIYSKHENVIAVKEDKKNLPNVQIRKVGRTSGILLKVFGGIGLGSFGIVFLILVLAGMGVYAVSNWLLPVVICAGVIWFGRIKTQRVKRAERYLQVMEGKAYINISELAHLTNMTEKYVRKDLKKMIRDGIFPEGHLDWNEQCLMLQDSVYKEYLKVEKRKYVLAKEDSEQHRFLEAQEKKIQKNQKTDILQPESLQNKEKEKKQADMQKFTSEERAAHDKMLEEGRQYIKQFRALNDAIEGAVISEKLFQLEDLLKEIFEQIEEHPEQISEMQKFMDYYLPTTLKLVQAYEEFDHVSVQGEDILSAKAEIEKTLDTINMAFAELLNKLFRDRVFDAATDVQVLKTMLAREGLTKELQ